MIGRPLMTPDELKALPKGHFILAKTGCHPMRTELRLFLNGGLCLKMNMRWAKHVARPVYYADRLELEQEIIRRQFEGIWKNLMNQRKPYLRQAEDWDTNPYLNARQNQRSRSRRSGQIRGSIWGTMIRFMVRKCSIGRLRFICI